MRPAERIKSQPSDNPQQLVDKADEALSILKGQMEQIKLKYDSLSEQSHPDIQNEKVRLEAQALTIKVSFLTLKTL